MAPLKKRPMSSPRRSGGSSVSGRTGSSANLKDLNAQYRALMRTAHEENRNGNPYNNKYAFTVQGKRKVSSKARKFIKTALLAGGVAGLGLFFKTQIGNDLTKLFSAIDMTTLPGTITKKAKKMYTLAQENKNKNPTNPGWGGRAMQGWNSVAGGARWTKNAAMPYLEPAQREARRHAKRVQSLVRSMQNRLPKPRLTQRAVNKIAQNILSKRHGVYGPHTANQYEQAELEAISRLAPNVNFKFKF
jgi:hypothetical protein